jgi:hypothetical protein
MSENGPREGTRDLPRPGAEAGRRAVTEDSSAGQAYGSISKSLRRRRSELAAMIGAGGTAASVARAYEAEHPLEPVVTADEVSAAVGEARVAVEIPPSTEAGKRRPEGRKANAGA